MNPTDKEPSRSPTPSPNIVITADGQTHRRFTRDLPVVKDHPLPPREQTVEVQDYEEESQVRKVQVPHYHVKEEFEIVDVPVKKPRHIREPRIDVLHRKIQIPKPVKKEKFMEMHQLHVVDRIVEKPEIITKEKVVERPKYIIQERIVPIPKRTVEEVTVKVPKDKFDEVVNSQIQGMQFSKTTRNEMQPLGASGFDGSQAQKLSGPKCRYIPRPVDVTLVNYKPKPVERIIDRHVPVPVEMHVTQEFQCPILIPTWAEAAVPVHVRRVIEKPVPADAMTHKVLLNMYMNQTKHIDEFAEKRLKGRGYLPGFKLNQTFPVRQKMTDGEIRAAGINTAVDTLKTMNSRTFDQMARVNASTSGGFFTNQRTLEVENRGKQAGDALKLFNPEG